MLPRSGRYTNTGNQEFLEGFYSVKLFKHFIQEALRPFGYQFRRLEQLTLSAYDPTTPLPDDASAILCPDNPQLLELDRRYREFPSPICRHSIWEAALRNNAEDLRYFRGETAYMWLYRSLGDAKRRFYVYAQYVRALDERDLMGRQLKEDGAFGCFTYQYERLPTVSRDLLDSINELYFLERHCGVLSRQGLRVLDIGAGFGRLAHRMLAANDGVESYRCIDAIPRSTFLCDYYLRYRGYAGKSDSRAVIVRLDEMEAAIAPGSIDLAINVHSFSEMCCDAIEAWVQWLVRLQVPRLFLVPNAPELLSTEPDRSHRDFAPILERAGFRRVAHEPTLMDPDARELVGVHDWFWLFERS
jgi:SAM-dependent methyltransferase